MPEDFFDERVASRYDAAHRDMFAPETVDPVVDFLHAAARGGRALELGIGTGRIALRLAERGVAVHGVDLSTAMAERLAAKPGGEGVAVTIGDFATAVVPGTFALVYVVFNTIMNLTTQDAQVACFANAARHLEPDGRFIVEVLVPALRRLPPGERARVVDVTADHVGIDEYDTTSQRLASHHYSVVDGVADVHSVPFRYVWPSELDLMARLAGMTLRERWGGWRREQFTDESAMHVSVYEAPAARPHG